MNTRKGVVSTRGIRKKNKNSPKKNSTKKKSTIIVKKKIDIPTSINKMEWVIIPKTDPKELVKSPENIETLSVFVYFFKRLMMQPKIRQFFVHQYRPDIEYFLVKIDWVDPNYEEKVKFIEQKIKETPEETDFIIDIAEQLSSGGHWTSLKRENGILEYMDPDPFYYGDASDDNNHTSFHKLVKKFPNPTQIYGNKNIMKTGLRAEKSIQNLHKNDKFCQSWSLFFLTTSHLYENIQGRIHFQKKEVALYEDKEKQYANFPSFLQNYLFLLDVWMHMFSDAGKAFNSLLASSSQWKKWKASKIVDKLGYIKRYLMKNQDNIITNIETQEDMFCLYENFIRDFMVKK